MEVLINKVEPEVVIKSEPDFEEVKEEIVAKEEEIVTDPLVITSENIKTEEEDMKIAETSVTDLFRPLPQRRSKRLMDKLRRPYQEVIS